MEEQYLKDKEEAEKQFEKERKVSVNSIKVVQVKLLVETKAMSAKKKNLNFFHLFHNF